MYGHLSFKISYLHLLSPSTFQKHTYLTPFCITHGTWSFFYASPCTSNKYTDRHRNYQYNESNEIYNLILNLLKTKRNLVNNNNNNNNIFHCKWAVARWQWLLCMYINMK